MHLVNFDSSSISIRALILVVLVRGISCASITLINRCDYTVWPGILGNSELDSTGFQLLTGGSKGIQAPPGWSGRVWGRTGCTFDPANGQGTCATGDCGSNQVECNGAGASPPATLAEFTIGSGTAQDFYDVSLVDGYNLPMIVETSGGSGSCLTTGCVTDLNERCPSELRSGEGGACKSACEAFGNPEYCCSGSYASPAACKPSVYSEIFKAACPRSYSYAFDDATSTFTCTGADFTITFCPSLASQKSSNAAPATMTSTSTGTGTGTSTDSNGSSIEPTGEGPMGVGGSWLTDFFTGDSSKTLSCFSWHTTFIFSLILFIFLSFV